MTTASHIARALRFFQQYSRVRPPSIPASLTPDVLMSSQRVRRFATRTDLLRGWRMLGPGGAGTRGGAMPRTNRVSNHMWADWLRRVMVENRYFGRLAAGAWSGTFFHQEKYPRRWSDASRLTVEQADWLAEWPRLLEKIEAGELPVLQRSARGGETTPRSARRRFRSVPRTISIAIQGFASCSPAP